MPPAVISRDEQGHVTVRAVRLTEPISLDGRLDERIYHDTEAIADFVQQEPREGTPATEKTEVWIAFDDDAVYVGARLWESDPSKRVMSDMRRDANNLSNNNDHFAILLEILIPVRVLVDTPVDQIRMRFRREEIPERIGK